MSDDLSHTIEIVSSRFDRNGPIPEEYNAGNCFYGRDVAELLCSELEEHGFEVDFLDEDWGWLCLGKTKHGKFLEICIYYWGEHDEADPKESDLWRLRLSMFEKRKFLGVLSKSAAIPAEQSLLDALRAIFQSHGIKVRRFEQGVEW